MHPILDQKRAKKSITSLCLGLCLACLTFKSNAENNPELVLQSGHSSAVMSLRFSDDGRWLVSSDMSGRVILWDLRTHMVARELRIPTERVSSIRVYSGFYLQSPDLLSDEAFDVPGDMLATASLQGPVRVWQLSSGELITTLSGSHGLRTLAMLPGLHLLAAMSEVGEIAVWNTQSWEKIHDTRAIGPEDDALAMFRGPEVINNARGLLFFVDGKVLGAVNRHRDLDLWNLSTWTSTTEPAGPLPYSVIAASKNGQTIVAGEIDRNTLQIHQVKEATQDQALVIPSFGLMLLALNESGDTMAAADRGGSIQVWKLAPASTQIANLTCNGATTLEFSSANSDLLAIGSADGSICLWRGPDFHENRILSGLSVGSLYLSFEGSTSVLRVIDGGFDFNSKTRGTRDWDWNLATGERKLVYFKSNPGLTYAPKGSAVLARPPMLRGGQIWSPDLRRPITHTVKAPSDDPELIHLFGTGVTSLTASHDGTLGTVRRGEWAGDSFSK